MAPSRTTSCLEACCGCTAFSAIAVMLLLVVTVRGCMNHRGRPTGGREFSFALSPTDNRIVFSGTGRGGLDLYMLETDGRVTRLTDTDEYESDPSFSPDGKWIVYAVGKESEGGDRLAILNVATKQTRYITDDGGNDSYPSFLPDGRSVTYLHQPGYAMAGTTPGWDTDAEIRRVQLDGSVPVFVRYTAEAHSSLSESRDGKLLAWDAISLAIGSQPSRHLTQPGAQHPSFSPDGKLIAFDQGENPAVLAIYVVPIAGGKPKQIVRDIPSTDPHFSFDGKWIYYLEDGTIWRVRPTGHDHSRAAPVDLFDQSAQR